MKQAIYRSDYEFCPGDVFRGATVVRSVKFYPRFAGVPAPLSPRHLLFVRRSDGTFTTACCDHQFRALDIYPLESGHPLRADAETRFNTLVDGYHADPRWTATL